MDTIPSPSENTFNMAKEQYTNKNYQESLILLKQYEDKNSFKYYLLRSKNYLNLNELSFALNEVKKCLTLEPNNPECLEQLFKVYIQMNDINEAENIFKKIEGLKQTEVNVNQLQKILEEKKSSVDNLKKTISSYSDYLFFIKELYKKNSFINKINVKFHTTSYRSVISTEKILRNEILLRIPLEALITLEMAEKSPFGKFITAEMQKRLNSPHHCVLSTFLLEEFEKKEKSEWYFYLKLLPESYNSFPLFYSDNEVETYLQGTQFYQTLQTKKKEMKADYDMLCNEIQGYNRFPYNDFCRARVIIASRIFGVTVHDRKTDVLAPYADMLNHKRPRETHWTFDDHENAFVLSAFQDIEEGKEIFDSYGKKCNSRFLLNYGFTIENNEDNEYKMTVVLDNTYPKYEEKSMLIKKNYTKKFSLRKDLEDSQTSYFFSFLRFCMDDGELSKYRPSSIISDEKINPISKENETKVLEKIIQLCKECLGQYKQTIEEDYKIFKNQNISFNERNCCVMRISEKEILIFYEQIAKFVLNLFKLSKEDAKRIIQDSKNEKVEEYKLYISQIKEFFE